MKVEDLKNLGLDDEQIKKVQALSGADVTAAKTSSQTTIDSLQTQIGELTTQVSQRDTDLADIKQKLETAGQSASKLSGLQTDLNNLQEKYDADTKAYKTKLEDQAYQFKLMEKVGGVEFSCRAAKTAFVDNLMKERLPVKDSEIIGFDDYLAKQKEADPGAFKVDTPPTDPKKPPVFVPPVDPKSNPLKDKVDFGFTFTGVRKKNDD